MTRENSTFLTAIISNWWCLFDGREHRLEWDSDAMAHFKRPFCIAACAEAEKRGAELPMKDWIDEAKINPELVITQLFAKFEAENERIRQLSADKDALISGGNWEIANLKSKLAKRNEALEFYATPAYWQDVDEGGDLIPAAIIDKGQRAAEALEGGE